jgi:hypothetical protein
MKQSVKTVTFEVDDELEDFIIRAAKGRRITQAQLITIAVMNYLLAEMAVSETRMR